MGKILDITNDQINEAFKGTNFGGNVETVTERKMFVAQAVLKRVCGYAAGNTITIILLELGLTKSLSGEPIKAAKRWMYEQYKTFS